MRALGSVPSSEEGEEEREKEEEEEKEEGELLSSKLELQIHCSISVRPSFLNYRRPSCEG